MAWRPLKHKEIIHSCFQTRKVPVNEAGGILHIAREGEQYRFQEKWRYDMGKMTRDKWEGRILISTSPPSLLFIYISYKHW